MVCERLRQEELVIHLHGGQGRGRHISPSQTSLPRTEPRPWSRQRARPRRRLPLSPATEVRALLQRVSGASVTVDGATVGSIGPGLVIFVGVGKDDGETDAQYVVDRCVNMRIFSDPDGRFDLSALQTGADLLVVSQFTLHADTRKGRRPSFLGAAAPEVASPLFDRTVEIFRETGLKVETGEFGAHMTVSIAGDGPVTIWLDSDDRHRPRRG